MELIGHPLIKDLIHRLHTVIHQFMTSIVSILVSRLCEWQSDESNEHTKSTSVLNLVVWGISSSNRNSASFMFFFMNSFLTFSPLWIDNCLVSKLNDNWSVLLRYQSLGCNRLLVCHFRCGVYISVQGACPLFTEYLSRTEHAIWVCRAYFAVI